MEPPKENRTPRNSPNIPSKILRTAKILQSLSTALATKFALKLFHTPVKFKTPEVEKKMARNAKKEILFIPAIKKEIMVYSYGSSKRKILLIHGWSGRGTQLFGIAEKMIENGFMTISFDAPAHGESSGKTTMMTEVIATVKCLEQKYGPFEIGIGHSFGGMTILNSLKQGVSFKKAVIIGSGDMLSDIIKLFIVKLELKPKFVDIIMRYYSNKFGIHIDTFSSSVAAKVITIPTLVIHDSDDKEVPVSCAYNIRQNLKYGDLLITKGLGHTRILKDKGTINKIHKYILQS